MAKMIQVTDWMAPRGWVRRSVFGERVSNRVWCERYAEWMASRGRKVEIRQQDGMIAIFADEK